MKKRKSKKNLLPIALTEASTKEPPHRSLFFLRKKRNQAQNLLGVTLWKVEFLVFVRHWDMACLELNSKSLLPSAICVQRFGNWKVLQLIPLIALCCVLQRNRKPSHPSRHVVRAIVNSSWVARIIVFFSLHWVFKVLYVRDCVPRLTLLHVLWEFFPSWNLLLPGICGAAVEVGGPIPRTQKSR